MRRPFGINLVRAGGLVLLFSVAGAVESFRLSSLHNPEVWLHLRVGEWILANKAWPSTGLFSQAVNLPWRDYTWTADAVAGVGYRVLGLSVVPALWMIYRVLLAGAMFLLAGGSRRNFWIPAAVSGVAQYLLYGLGPLGSGTSALFVALEFFLLVQARRSRSLRKLFLLVPLFVFWANADAGFVYGIGLFVLFLAATVVERIQPAWSGQPERQSGQGSELATAPMACGACMLATLLSPYGFHSYVDFLAAQTSPVNQYISAHTAMNFRQPQHYVLVLLVMSAFLLLGVRRSRDLFLLSALIGSTALGFYAQGESWLAILASLAVIGDSVSEQSVAPLRDRQYRSAPQWPVVEAAAALAVLLVCYAAVVPRQRDVLLSRVAEEYPIRACDYIRQHRLPAPLFNTQNWGSFLVWYLPEYPVAIDARTGLYPDDVETDYFKAMLLLAPYQSVPSLGEARTLLFEKSNVLGEAFQGVPGFQVAHEDGNSLVLLHETHE